MKKRFFPAFFCLSLISLLIACSGNDNQDNAGTSQQAVELPRPTPSFAGVVEVGRSIPIAPEQTRAVVNKTAGSPATPSLLAQTTVTAAADNTLGPISTTDPRQILGVNRA